MIWSRFFLRGFLTWGLGVVLVSIAFGFPQQPMNKTICMTVPPGSTWRTLHCTKKPPGCHRFSSGCLNAALIYKATTHASDFIELTYTACHWNNDPSTNCLTTLPIVDCQTFSAWTALNGVQCGKLECTGKLTILSCDPMTAVPPYGDPPGYEGGGIGP